MLEEYRRKENVFINAAIQADMDLKNTSISSAKRRIIVRGFRISISIILLLVGLATVFLPGPGFLLIAASLAILAIDITWTTRAISIYKTEPSNKSKRNYGLILTTVASVISFLIWFSSIGGF